MSEATDEEDTDAGECQAYDLVMTLHTSDFRVASVFVNPLKERLTAWLGIEVGKGQKDLEQIGWIKLGFGKFSRSLSWQVSFDFKGINLQPSWV